MWLIKCHDFNITRPSIEIRNKLSTADIEDTVLNISMFLEIKEISAKFSALFSISTVSKQEMPVLSLAAAGHAKDRMQPLWPSTLFESWIRFISKSQDSPSI